MALSIIIPVLNEEERIPRLIHYLKQHGGNEVAEIIVVDGNSSDRSAAIARQSGAVVIQTSANRASQMNAGAKIAQSDILYFVHADTTPPPNYVAAIQQSLKSGWLMGCFRSQFDSPNWLLKLNAWFTQFRFMVCQGGDKTFFITRELFDQMNGYDEQYVVMEEYDFLRRAVKARLQFTVMPEAVLISARKYENRTWARVQLANIVVFNLWKWGLAKPERLRDIYKRLLAS